jgi:hypothetical protein
MKRISLTVALMTASIMVAFTTLNAQVGINTENPQATLDVAAGKTDGTLADGIIAPRMTLVQLNNARKKYTAAQIGAEVYITDVSGTTIPGYSDQVTCIGVIYWNGIHWTSDCALSRTYAIVTQQPKAFTFYEEGTEAIIIAPLTFGAGGSSTMSYQWYKIIGSNIHVRVGQKCDDSDGTGATTASFTPTSVKKGTTRNANNTGFYRYYCVAKNLTNDSVVSNVAEVAMGCGAKNKDGEWFTFMCFNLGASQMTIDEQRNTTLTFSTANDANGVHYYITDEEKKYGDLYQWGRIRDGHEQRGTNAGFANGSNAAGANQITYSSATPPTYESGNLIGVSIRYPYIQIKRNTTYYGKFIISSGTQDYNWANPAIGAYADNNLPTNITQGIIDQLWRDGRFAANDPCAKINEDGKTYETFYPATNGISGSSTSWRTPSQEEWGEIYRGGSANGSPDNALANTWTWHDSNGRGYDIKPDGTTITLHLPANGYRPSINNVNGGRLYMQGTNGDYWSTTYTGSDAYNLNFDKNGVRPADISLRGYGFAIRCIRSN